ncbi:hypothetical protein [Campylobacter coli]|uniref:hypothetical protein n=1 Tax=Campylobacter coli TaxID=195 RepID=UPI001BFF5A11|nr:hypothetical protein [Campylobacter coli]
MFSLGSSGVFGSGFTSSTTLAGAFVSTSLGDFSSFFSSLGAALAFFTGSCFKFI